MTFHRLAGGVAIVTLLYATLKRWQLSLLRPFPEVLIHGTNIVSGRSSDEPFIEIAVVDLSFNSGPSLLW